VNAKVNKQLINDELELEPIRSKKPPILQLILDRLDKIDNTFAEHGKAIATLGENDKKIFDVLNRNNIH
jgi:hypothetical protein